MNTTSDSAGLWETAEAADYLRTTSRSLHTMICRKRLPTHLYTRMGRKLLFFREKVIAWVREGCPSEK